MAFRMQMSVPELTDLSTESRADLDMYGPEVDKTGSFARNCLLAGGWLNVTYVSFSCSIAAGTTIPILPRISADSARDVDQPIAGLLKDLKQRGLLDDTLVVFAGEFGRTTYYGQSIKDRNNYGRDHHPRCFTTWMAGGGIKGGISYGAKPTTSATTLRRILSTFATFTPRCCINWASTTSVYRSRIKDSISVLPASNPAAWSQKSSARLPRSVLKKRPLTPFVRHGNVASCILELPTSETRSRNRLRGNRSDTSNRYSVRTVRRSTVHKSGQGHHHERSG